MTEPTHPTPSHSISELLAVIEAGQRETLVAGEDGSFNGLDPAGPATVHNARGKLLARVSANEYEPLRQARASISVGLAELPSVLDNLNRLVRTGVPLQARDCRWTDDGDQECEIRVTSLSKRARGVP